ncbi:hypothetical protein [Sphingobacterium sp. SYP-B4668]|uniref:hypothetical protein n=1 Tax=Sphingobacterium sp. SYP-B4668 TaxID=2996035 RepID=UPI0022DD1591|nr:hypothetical protein [Sphingobacterium sp. SYP-B4668]
MNNISFLLFFYQRITPMYIRLLICCIFMSTLANSCHNPTRQNSTNDVQDSVSTNRQSRHYTIKEMPQGIDKWQMTLFQKARVKDTFSFINDAYSKVSIQVSPVHDSIGNIRINNIIMPDNQTDGPFGRQMVYPLQQRGRYRIVVGESQMQGDAFEGDYRISIQLTK